MFAVFSVFNSLKFSFVSVFFYPTWFMLFIWSCGIILQLELSSNWTFYIFIFDLFLIYSYLRLETTFFISPISSDSYILCFISLHLMCVCTQIQTNTHIIINVLCIYKIIYVTCVCFYFSVIHSITKFYLFVHSCVYMYLCMCVLVCVNRLACATAWVEITGQLTETHYLLL